MPDRQPNHYDVLGVPEHADGKTIRQAYLRQSLKNHPDKNPDDPEGSKERFVEIGEAYGVLKDPTTRREYDRDLTSGAWTGQSRGFDGSGARYNSYREAFDDAMAGLSDAELNTALGAASVLGSIIGSALGSRLSGKTSGKSGSILKAAGSMMGSVAGSEAANNVVKSLHEQSVERVTYEKRRQSAEERGEEVPDPPPRSQDGWMEFVGKTVESIKGKALESNQSSSRKSAGTREAPNEDKWKRAVGTALNVAEAFAELHATPSSKRQPAR